MLCVFLKRLEWMWAGISYVSFKLSCSLSYHIAVEIIHKYIIYLRCERLLSALIYPPEIQR